MLLETSQHNKKGELTREGATSKYKILWAGVGDQEVRGAWVAAYKRRPELHVSGRNTGQSKKLIFDSGALLPLVFRVWNK